MMKLQSLNIFLSVVPVRNLIISVALHPTKVQQILTRNLVPELVMGSGWSADRYTGSLEDNILFLKGPFGNKRWCLLMLRRLTNNRRTRNPKTAK